MIISTVLIILTETVYVGSLKSSVQHHCVQYAVLERNTNFTTLKYTGVYIYIDNRSSFSIFYFFFHANAKSLSHLEFRSID